MKTVVSDHLRKGLIQKELALIRSYQETVQVKSQDV